MYAPIWKTKLLYFEDKVENQWWIIATTPLVELHIEFFAFI